MPQIHPTALVDRGAQLAEDVVVGPYCIVGSKAVLKNGVKLLSHVIISNETTLGENSIVHPFASLGAPGQIYKHGDEIGRLVVGARCEIREYVTMNCGSPRGHGVTEIGADCMFMIGAHVAHDCTVGEKCIFANNATLGGHVVVGEQVFLGGLSAVHQFCTIGEHAMIGGGTIIRGHTIPFGNTMGDRGALIGLNLVGLKRRGFGDRDIKELNRAYRDIFLGPGVLAQRLEKAEIDYAGNAHVQRIISFIRGASKKRPLSLPMQR